MRRLLSTVWLGALALCAATNSPVCAQSRDIRGIIDLDGIWGFATDMDNQGEIEKWFLPDVKLPAMPLPGYDPAANGEIRVPGIWDNQGYGTPTEKVHHNFVGKGWYKHQVDIPSAWAERRLFLVVTGVNRYAKTWVNGHYLGEHIGCLSIIEHEITRHVVPGKTATITIQVDSRQRWEVDALYGTSQLADYMDIAWGGIWGHVRLEARSGAWLSDLFVRPELSDSSCSVFATLNGDAALPDAARLDVFDKSGQRLAQTITAIDDARSPGQPLAVKATVPAAELWTPDTPALYTARLSLLKNEAALDAIESHFGMRQYTIDGFRFLLNGKRLILRGYGDDHVYPRHMAMPSDKELHLAQLLLIKSYGFNYVRNHSAIMPPEYYEACDEVGMIASAEFPICYHLYLPGTGCKWQANSLSGTDPNVAIHTYKREWRAVIKQYRNHPSIFCWVMGNELYDANPLRAEFHAIARELDPTRFYIDSDSVATQVLDPQHDRDTLDFYTIPFNEGTNPLDNPAKYDMGQPKKPVIAHESGNYVTFSRPDLIDQFQNNFKPFWLTSGRATLEELGLRNEAGRWAEKSERLYMLCQKYNTEALRANTFISGYQWWNFQDYWNTANGLVDHYFRPKSIAPEEVLKVNGDVVLLQSGLERTYRGGSRMEATLLIANSSFGPIAGMHDWEVNMGGQSIGKQQVALNPVSQGDLAEMTRIDLELPDVTSPVKLTVAVELAAGDKRFANEWRAWLYPREIRPERLPAPVFADAKLIEDFKNVQLDVIPTTGTLSEHAVYMTDRLDDRRLVDAMERGACVVILGAMEGLLESRVLTFRPSWWRGTTNNQVNHAGTFVYDHPVTRDMAPEGWCDEGWVRLIQGSQKYSLATAPVRPNIVIRALPTLEKVEDESLLFEVAIGNGCLIASGLNHHDAREYPENEWFLARLLEYAAGFPRPRAVWPASFLKASPSVH